MKVNLPKGTAKIMKSNMDYIKIEKSAKAHKKILDTVTYILLAFWAVVVLFPFYWMVLTSLKS